ncbi:cyclic AMP-responsive element-binding protein 3-like protein 3 [Chiloscyllium plagiosum]|uniref:cyclic AMP-responsive element-binding protein 3-like protein 3 n=1 Tax=Chiloscyllium plagiosum TaxID=36176 RepID=UPI001CB85346|nr:cyclic AMP-responsive element-binding protein 3-like protein 3 [Chiloscyllium plagiosum]
MEGKGFLPKFQDMTLVTGKIPAEGLPRDLDSVELLDLLFDQKDGILRHEGFNTDGSGNPEGWGMAQPSIHSGSSNEEFLSSILADAVPASPLWSSAGSDSGISEDHLSDQLDSPQHCVMSSSPQNMEAVHNEPPFQPRLEPSCWATGLRVPELGIQGAEISLGFDDWNSEPFQEEGRNIPSQPTADNFLSLTVKDLLLSNTNETHKPQLQPHQARELVLNEDEKKLLVKEGITLPSQLPLTKQEERILKKIRRKIRNKQSAQESRKKKKEYIDGLENRMAACTAQNHELQRKVIRLEKQNMTLLQQLRKLQTLVMHSTGRTAQTSTCIMVLMLSFALVIFPSFSSFSFNKGGKEDDFTPVRVFSRSLHDLESSRVFQVLSSPHSHAAGEKYSEWNDQLHVESRGTANKQDQTVNGKELTQDTESHAPNGSNSSLRIGDIAKGVTILKDLNPEDHIEDPVRGHSPWTELTPDHRDEM